MNIQRLKFAWARGARVEFLRKPKFEGGQEYWAFPTKNYGGCPSWNPKNTYRIHPDDEYLSYGPISRALLEQACRNEFEYSEELNMGHIFAEREGGVHFDVIGDDLCDFYVAFIAEFLADEGL